MPDPVKSLTHAQRIALTHPCRLAIETVHPRFRRIDRVVGCSVVLTVNSGYE